MAEGIVGYFALGRELCVGRLRRGGVAEGGKWFFWGS
jgi:hypothetical protein